MYQFTHSSSLDSKMQETNYKLLPHLLNAAKRLLPIFWKKEQIPSKDEWICRVNAIREAEEWVAVGKNTTVKHTAIWSIWHEHFQDTSYVPSSLDISLLKLADPTLGHRAHPK